MNNKLPWLSLFASSGTLICCALPSLLVALGFGAAMAGLVTTVPQLVWLSQYKEVVFAISGIMILLSGILYFRSRNDPCPLDPQLATACRTTRKWSFWVLILSGTLWLAGAFFAFVAVRVF